MPFGVFDHMDRGPVPLDRLRLVEAHDHMGDLWPLPGDAVRSAEAGDAVAAPRSYDVVSATVGEEAMKSSIRVLPALTALLLLTACSEPRSAQVLNSRVTTSMTRAHPCTSAASVQYLPNGARITMPDTALFVVGRTDISQCGEFALTSAVQAMLAPRIMQVVIEPGGDVNSPEAFLPRERTERLKEMLSNVGFAPSQPPVLVQPAPAPSAGVWGVVLTVAG